MEEVRYFMWYDTDYRSRGADYGPHYYGDEKKIGKRLYHTLDDLLETSLSDSVKKRLKGAKIGTKIKAHYLHSSGDLMLKRIDPEVTKILDKIMKLDKESSKLRTEVGKKEYEVEQLFSKVK